MTINEFYEQTDGNFSEVVSNLGKEERVYKYLDRFSKTDIIEKISAALDEGDYETAFREAHNLKGMSLNVGIVSLQKVACSLTESLRNGPTGDVEALLKSTVKEYRRCCEMIEQLER